MKNNKFTHSLLEPIVNRTVTFLQEDMIIDVLNKTVDIDEVNDAILKDNTVMIGTGGDIQVILTFGYDQRLIEKLVYVFMDGEIVDEDEKEEIEQSVCCEIANTIIGNSIKNPMGESLISITPPILIKAAKSFTKYKNSTILVSVIKTNFGDLHLSAVGPKELFVDKLDFKEL